MGRFAVWPGGATAEPRLTVTPLQDPAEAGVARNAPWPNASRTAAPSAPTARRLAPTRIRLAVGTRNPSIHAPMVDLITAPPTRPRQDSGQPAGAPWRRSG